MKKLILTGTILTLVFTAGTAAFAASTADPVKTENPAALIQSLDISANNTTPKYSSASGHYNGNCQNYVDANGDGICDNWNEGMHNNKGQHRGHKAKDMHNGGSHHGTCAGKNATIISD